MDGMGIRYGVSMLYVHGTKSEGGGEGTGNPQALQSSLLVLALLGKPTRGILSLESD